MALRSFDTFVKPRDDLRTRSAVGGIITLVASIAASLLFLAELYLYVAGSTRQSLHLSPSNWVPMLPGNVLKPKKFSGIPLNVRVTFLHVGCSDLDVAHDNASLSAGEFQKIHGHNAMRLRQPTTREFEEASPDTKSRKETCTIEGKLDIAVVGGTFQITISNRAWEARAAMAFMNKKTTFHNVSHYVHSVTFGDHFPLAHNPLERVPHTFINEHNGVGLSLVTVKLVPTLYKTMFSQKNMYQSSVTHTFVKPETLAGSNTGMLPGLVMTYDFTPLAVRHEEYRESFLVFLSSLVSIVGGVFVTVGLVTGCLVHSAAAVAKKMD